MKYFKQTKKNFQYARSFYEQKTLIRDSRRIKLEKSNKQLERQKTENKTCKIKHKRIGMSEWRGSADRKKCYKAFFSKKLFI